jgi:hypothetical protein
MPTRSEPSEHSKRIVATVQEVLPRLGLAYAMDDDGRCWGITRAAAGDTLGALSLGDKVALVVEHHQGFDIASACSPLQPHD